MKNKLHIIGFVLLIMAVQIPAFAQKKGKKAKGADNISADVATSNTTTIVKVEEEAIFIEAMKMVMLGEQSAAAAGFRKVLEKNPKNHAAMYELGRIELSRQNLEEAEKYLVMALKLYPYNEWYYHYLADIKATKGDFSGAAKTYESLVGYFPKKYDFYYDWAYMLSLTSNPLSAIPVLEKLEKMVGPQEEIILNKADVYASSNKIDEAEKEIRKLINANPTEMRYYSFLGELLKQAGKLDKAKAVYEELIAKDPDNIETKFVLADIYKQEGNTEKYDQTITAIFRDKKIDIDDKIQYIIPMLQLLDEQDPVAVEEITNYINILEDIYPDDIKLLTVKGDLLYTIGEKDKSVAYYNRALASDAEAPSTIWLQLMTIYADNNDYQHVAETADRALVKFKDEAFIYFYKGIADYQLKDYQGAVAALEEGLSKKIPTAAMRSQMLTTLGDACNELKWYEKSDSSYEKALEIDPNNPFTLNNYAYYLSVRNEKLEKAERMSKKSNLLEENNPAFMDTYAWILYQKKSYPDALKWIEKALKAIKDGDRTELLDHYGDILYRLGRVDEAVQQWQKAADEGGNKATLLPKIQERKIIE